MNNATPKRRSRDEAKHEAILKAASRLFLKHGYTDTSMDAIADAARVTKQTVYSHYKSKDALFLNMLEDLSAKHSPPESFAKLTSKPFEQGLYDVGIILLNTYTNSEVMALTRLVVSECGKNPELARRYYEGGSVRMMNLLSDFLRHYVEKGQLPLINTNSAASHFIGMMKGQYYVRMILALKPVPTLQDKQAHVRECVAIFQKVFNDGSPLQTSSSL